MFGSGMIIGLSIALIVGVLVYVDAKNRGESNAIGWGIFTFAILILALPLYYIMVVNKPKKTDQLAEEKRISRICPQCGRNLTSFPDDIKNCPYCGRMF